VNYCPILFPCRVDFARITYHMPDGVETRSSSRIAFKCITFTNSRCEADRWPLVRMYRSLATQIYTHDECIVKYTTRGNAA
jgi:hypothetical protein